MASGGCGHHCATVEDSHRVVRFRGITPHLFGRSCCVVDTDRIPRPSRSAVEEVLADTLVGQGSILLAAHQGGAGPDFWMRSVREVVGVLEPAGVIFCHLAKRRVAA